MTAGLILVAALNGGGFVVWSVLGLSPCKSKVQPEPAVEFTVRAVLATLAVLSVVGGRAAVAAAVAINS